MIIKIDTDKMKKFPEEPILIWCPLKNSVACTDRCKMTHQCSDQCIIKGKLASASPIKRWLNDIKETE